MNEKKPLRNVELSLIAELMKNSRRSDRELSRALGVSQPTVSRLISKLEKEGYIKEYTMIPDFCKLGYGIMAITFALSRTLDKEEADKARKLLADSVKDEQFEFIMLERGRGLGFDGVIISLHEDYSSYVNVLKWLRQFDFLDVARIDSFLVSLDDEVRYRPLTFSTLATHLLLKGREHKR
jgi:DNA-binding Lrp family transcriptional regulator